MKVKLSATRYGEKMFDHRATVPTVNEIACTVPSSLRKPE